MFVRPFVLFGVTIAAANGQASNTPYLRSSGRTEGVRSGDGLEKLQKQLFAKVIEQELVADLAQAELLVAGTAADEEGLDFSSEFVKSERAPGPNKPVRFELLYEAMCPYCKHWMTRVFTMLDDECYESVSWNFVAYGNAKESKGSDGKYKFECQHGEEECRANKLQLCSWNILKTVDPLLTLSTAVCLEGTAGASPLTTCLGPEHKELATQIQKCAESERADQLMHRAALETARAAPNKEGVPWLLINGKHSEAAETDLSGELCRAGARACCKEKPTKSADVDESDETPEHSPQEWTT